MSKEEWRDVAGYKGVYQVSDHGRVRRTGRAMGATPGYVLKPFITGGGYLQVALHRCGKRKGAQVHRLVAESFLPRPPGCNEVNHKNGDKTDNRVDNLEWVTPSQNVRHALNYLGVKRAVGERNGASKVTRRDVKKIRQLYSTGDYTLKVLGEMVGLSLQAVSYIVNRKTWKHVP